MFQRRNYLIEKFCETESIGWAAPIDGNFSPIVQSALELDEDDKIL